MSAGRLILPRIMIRSKCVAKPMRVGELDAGALAMVAEQGT